MQEGSWDRVHTSKVRVSWTDVRAHKETRKKDTGDFERRAHKGCVGSKGVGAHSCAVIDTRWVENEYGRRMGLVWCR